MRTLEVHHAAALDVAELSALTIRSGPEGRPQLLAVGDEDFAVVSARLGDGDELGGARREDLRPALRDSRIELGARSGFEGVACDGAGTVVLLQEERARLLVLAPDLSRLLHVLDLAVPSGDPDLDPAWHRHPNTRGEGLLLLRRGHVLVAKQRDDPGLIEFGPPGDPPTGVAPATVLAPDEPFRWPDATASELVPLAVWWLAGDTVDVLPTINDLTLGPDGRVYALSARTGVIARLEGDLEPGERARATDVWEVGKGLPGGRDARPEGLAILPSGRPVIGVDTKRHGKNVVTLQRLDIL